MSERNIENSTDFVRILVMANMKLKENFEHQSARWQILFCPFLENLKNESNKGDEGECEGD